MVNLPKKEVKFAALPGKLKKFTLLEEIKISHNGIPFIRN
jgi:hypothetical protein